MAYTKTLWTDPQGTNLNRFSKSNETATSVDLTQNPTLTNTPTAFSVELMNKLEQGVYDAHVMAESNFLILNSQADEVDGMGRNLLDVLGVTTISAAMAAIRTMCNGTGQPDFRKLRYGDYLDGINLSAIPAENGGDAGQAWNSSYLNNRIVISGFNTYKNSGSTETSKNHVLFTFRNCPIRKRMNPTNDNAGGYHASELRAFMDGTNGDGTGNYTGATTVTTGAFLTALKAQLGDYILRVHRIIDASTFGGSQTWGWQWYSVFLPTENEMVGDSAWGRPDYGDGLKVHFPIYQKSTVFRCKRYNGARQWHFLATPNAGSAAYFAFVSNTGSVHTSYSASSVGGCAPAFCVA